MSSARQCMCGNISVTGDPASTIKSASCHSRFRLDSKFPVLQIHKGAIAIASFSQITTDTVDNRQIDVTCSECGWKLGIYASNKGAYCQFREPTFSAIYGSLPAESFLAQVSGGSVPRAMKPLFRQKEFDTFDIAEDPSGKDGLLGTSSQEGDNDYDLMFSNSGEPFVGSYSEIGEFTVDKDNFLFLE